MIKVRMLAAVLVALIVNVGQASEKTSAWAWSTSVENSKTHTADFAWLAAADKNATKPVLTQREQYDQLRDQAILDQEPLLVYVGCEPKSVPGCLSCRWDAFPGVRGPAVVIGLPNMKGELLRGKILACGSTAAQIHDACGSFFESQSEIKTAVASLLIGIVEGGDKKTEPATRPCPYCNGTGTVPLQTLVGAPGVYGGPVNSFWSTGPGDDGGQTTVVTGRRHRRGFFRAIGRAISAPFRAERTTWTYTPADQATTTWTSSTVTSFAPTTTYSYGPATTYSYAAPRPTMTTANGQAYEKQCFGNQCYWVPVPAQAVTPPVDNQMPQTKTK